MNELARTVEALLFVAPEPLEVTTIHDITGEPPSEIGRALDDIRERHGDDTGLELAEVAGGWALRPRADLAPACDKLRARPREARSEIPGCPGNSPFPLFRCPSGKIVSIC